MHDSEYCEYGFFKVGTHMRLDSHPPTLLGQRPKFDRIFLLMASLKTHPFKYRLHNCLQTVYICESIKI